MDGISINAISTLIRFSNCIPSSCSKDDAEKGLNSFLQAPEVTSVVNIPFHLYAIDCQAEDKPIKPTSGDWGMIAVISLFGGVILVSTLVDLSQKFQDKTSMSGKPLAFFQGFSMYSNLCKLLDTRQGPESISCINGIRFLSMTWVVVGHTFYVFVAIFGMPVFLKNPFDFVNPDASIWTPAFAVIWNAQDSVDSFFLIGAILLSYTTIKELDKAGGGSLKFWLMFYVHRYLRLTGVYLIVILLHMTLIKFLPAGPQTNIINDAQLSSCQEWWWTNLLYINNYISDTACMGHCWYMAVDMQFFIWSPLVLYPLYKKPKVGLILSGILAVIATAIPMAVTIARNDPNDGLSGNHETLYMKPGGRYQPYIVGLVVGYFLYAKKNMKTLPISWVLNLIIWACAWVTGLALIFGVARHHPASPVPISLVEQVFYASFNRLAWAIALSWVIVACVKGKGGLVSEFLSWGGWVPVARLSYVMYLVHFLVLFNHTTYNRDSVTYTTGLYVYDCLANVLLTGAAALVVVLMFEMPILHMEKLFFALVGVGRWPKAKMHKEHDKTISTLHGSKEVNTTGRDGVKKNLENGIQVVEKNIGKAE